MLEIKEKITKVIKMNKILNLTIFIIFVFSQTTLQASLLPNSQIQQSNLNSVSTVGCYIFSHIAHFLTFLEFKR